MPLASLHEVEEALNTKRSQASPSLRREYESSFEDYLIGHDLGRVSSGVALRSVVVVKQGLYGWLLTDDGATRYRLSEIVEPLENLASELATRLGHRHDNEATGAVSAWQSRFDLDWSTVAEIATGLSSAEVDLLQDASPEFRREVMGWNDVTSWQVSPAENELLAAARLSADLPPNLVAQIISLIASEPLVSTAELDELSDTAAEVLTNSSYAYDEGYDVARWLRERLGLSPYDRVDPERLLEEYGVAVRPIGLMAGTIDAVGAWGPRHGPCVVINTSGRHAQHEAGRRATAAHELCHLLLDRSGALPIADALRGQENTPIEARARAFAAELLLPRQAAAEEHNSSPDDPRDVVEKLMDRFGVSRELAAWNIRNSGVAITPKARSILRTMVQQPERY